MNEAKWKKWEQTRQRGRSHYIWIYWVLLWGASMAIWWISFTSLIYPGKQPPAILLVSALAIYPLFGYFIGIVAWKSKENKYAQWLEKSGARN